MKPIKMEIMYDSSAYINRRLVYSKLPIMGSVFSATNDMENFTQNIV